MDCKSRAQKHRYVDMELEEEDYDAIIKKSVLGSTLNFRKGNRRWTALISFSLGLPLVLSAAYKIFTGGRVNTTIETNSGIYGLSATTGFDDFTSCATLMVNATLPFVSSTAHPEVCENLHLNDASTILSDFAYGYNTTGTALAAQLRCTAIVAALFWSRLRAYCGISYNPSGFMQEERKQLQYHVNDSAPKSDLMLHQPKLLAFVLLIKPILALVF
ncbi:hypothetical protein K469DRAFT_693343 [Zopfia rhizophila CBS 207.26]|uniref:Uncharacterized protein n=1 Tax=Zopfia rhizophila CBS 207.26 TaxID=1314779 RepID=A0A6A6DP99_9PEZI|nr:hypothetical protein K469DRAFT_693343 [Zopfia rhizophila CBS 207.26]